MSYLESLKKIQAADYSKLTEKERDVVARDVIDLCAFTCAGLVLQPIPGLEQTVLPIQVMMVLTVAHVYGQELSRKKAMDILLDLARITGASIVTRQVLVTVTKLLLPVLGGVLSAPVTFSMTWAVGYASIYYLRSGGRVDERKIKEIFEQERERSKSYYSEDKARSHRPSKDEIPRE